MSKFLRPGFTLLEVLVAVVLIDVGLLALVAGSAVVVRQRAQTRARAAAVQLAANRLQNLGVSACAAGAGEAPGLPGTMERWTVQPLANGVLEIADSVSFVAGGSTHTLVLRTRLPC